MKKTILVLIAFIIIASIISHIVSAMSYEPMGPFPMAIYVERQRVFYVQDIIPDEIYVVEERFGHTYSGTIPIDKFEFNDNVVVALYSGDIYANDELYSNYSDYFKK